MTGATKLFAATIDVREMTKSLVVWVAEIVGAVTQLTHALAELLHAVNSIPRSQNHAVDYCQQRRDTWACY
jgi:hypothetical protein